MERISTHQFMTLGAAVLMGITFLTIASNVTGASGRDGWMAILPGFAVGIPYGLMILSLLAQYPHRNLLQISETLFEKWIRENYWLHLYFNLRLFWRIVTGPIGGCLSAINNAINTPLGVLCRRTSDRSILGKLWN